MKIVLDHTPLESPSPAISRLRADQRETVFSEDYWGAFSLETFASATPLSHTHEDAAGWLNYLTKIKPANFWYKDKNVAVWAYYETYDNWQDTYGVDAVNACYHSGHGGMDNNGVFYAAMGSNWENQGTSAISSNMRIGNEQLRYMFWSTCLSLRVKDGHTPMRTWSNPNLGLRMIFGFETTSVDSPNYGKYFWQKWQSNKSFGSAWLDASWSISTGQEPSVAACGATEAEAKDRVFNERQFSWDAVTDNWMWWRWYNKARADRAWREPRLILPRDLLIAELVRVRDPGTRLQNLAKRYALDAGLPDEVHGASDGAFLLKLGNTDVAFDRLGAQEISFASANLTNRNQIPVNQAIMVAEDTVRRRGLDRNGSLILDAVRLAWAAGSSRQGSGRLEEAHVTETTVCYRQVINGVPVLSEAQGEVNISIDNDGQLTSIRDSTRAIERLSDRPQNTTASPGMDGPIARARAIDTPGCRHLLAETWQEHLNLMSTKGPAPLSFAAVPGTTEIAYDIRGNEAALVAQQEIEVDMGGGFRKRYKVVTPIVE